MPETSPIAETELEPVDVSMGGTTSARREPADGQDVLDAAAESGLYHRVADVVKIIRPAIQADNGDIFLRAVDEATGVVSVELVGACITCPASTQTLKQGLERILTQRVDGVTAVEHVGAPLVGNDEGTPVSL
ncbi:MAG: NifU family protein [Acidimicrobiia bacterium]|nr:NifU family protein [Acidimicrobiia bacterium]